MPDDRQGRNKQAHDEERRQRNREIDAAVERRDEPEPPTDRNAILALEAALEPLEYPVTGREVVEAVGDRTVAAGSETYAVATLVADARVETFESPADVTERIHRPTTAAAMKRIVEASSHLSDGSVRGSQWKTYEKTFRALAAVDAVDEDEAITTVADWIVERIEQTNRLPGSRAVRRQAAAVCREAGYEVRSNEWLGV